MRGIKRSAMAPSIQHDSMLFSGMVKPLYI
jgi:hypothetical protein